jgi:hypothetical protein
MPEPKEDRLCVPCLLVFCAIAISIVLLLKCIKFTCDHNRRTARASTPCDTIAAELIDLGNGGNKIVVNPDGEMMAAMTETIPDTA